MKSLNQIGGEFNEHSGCRLSAWDGTERAAEELDEARAEANMGDMVHFVEECADVILTLASVCVGLDLDLDAVVQVKHVINLRRQWQPHPTIPGGVSRIKRPK